MEMMMNRKTFLEGHSLHRSFYLRRLNAGWRERPRAEDRCFADAWAKPSARHYLMGILLDRAPRWDGAGYENWDKALDELKLWHCHHSAAGEVWL